MLSALVDEVSYVDDRSIRKTRFIAQLETPEGARRAMNGSVGARRALQNEPFDKPRERAKCG